MPTRNLTSFGSTYVASRYPGTNYGGLGYAIAGRRNYEGVTELYKALIYFYGDWNKIPDGAVIDRARLRFYVSAIWGANTTTLKLFENSNTWSLSQTTYNNHPDYGAQLDEISVRYSSYNTAHITAWAREVFRGGNINVTKAQRGFRFGNTGARSVIRKTGHPPYIIIDYHSPPTDIRSAIRRADLHTVDIEGVGNVGRIDVYRSASGPYSGFARIDAGAGEPTSSTWRHVDSPPVPVPNTVGTPSVSKAGSDLLVDWTNAGNSSRQYWYNARRMLSDGTVSDFDAAPVSVVVTATIRNFTVQRRAGTTGNWISIAQTSNTSYRDTSVNAEVTYYYRIIANNTAGGSSSPSGAAAGRIERPDAPTFSSLTVVDRKFRLSGGGAVVGGGNQLRVYSAADKVNFSLVATYGITGSAWTTEPTDVDFNAFAPPKPTFDPPVKRTNDVAILFTWQQAANKPSSFRFFVRQYAGAIESFNSVARDGSYTPLITRYVLTRVPVSNLNATPTVVYDGPERVVDDNTGLVPDKEYEYTLVSYNDKGKASPPAKIRAKAPLPAAPTNLKLAEIQDNNGNRMLRLTGENFNAADYIRIERQDPVSLTWISLGDARIGTIDESAEWWLDYDPVVPQPAAPLWRPTGADRSGITLQWQRPDNPPANIRLRARRFINNVASTPAVTPLYQFVANVISFRIERREKGVLNWTRVRDAYTEQLYKDIIDDDNPDAVHTGSEYSYRIRAINEKGLVGHPSDIRTHQTIELAAEAPPPAPAAKPLLETGYPRDTLDVITSTPVLIRTGWEYSSPDNSTHAAYELKIEYDHGTGIVSRWWNGQTWGSPGAVARVVSDSPVAQVSNVLAEDGYLQTGKTYTLTAISHSRAGGVSDPLTWSFVVSALATTRFKLRREITQEVTTGFKLHREVTSHSAEYELPLTISWRTEKPLPYKFDPSTWEGGFTTWSYQISDNTGRPEPYAELDFLDPDDNELLYTFQADERGRLLLRIPQDVRPSIYTLRERGPSMVARVIPNQAVVDTWSLYSHGLRHGADGEDPIRDIVDSQIDPNAGIDPNKVAGAESLAALVNRFGPDIITNIEKHISAGHANYVVDGLELFYDTVTSAVRLTAGTAWESGSLTVLSEQQPSLVSGVEYYLYVQGGGLIVQQTPETGTFDFPPGAAPLYIATLDETVSPAVLTIQDRRLRHPAAVITGNVLPVRWGASTTDQIMHDTENVSAVIDRNRAIITSRQRRQESILDEFRSGLEVVRDIAAKEEQERNRMRLVSLANSYAAVARHLYALMEGRYSAPLRQASAIQRHGESSPLSTMSMDYQNGRATLPEDWSPVSWYTLRTLRISFPASKRLQFHLLYEDTGTEYTALGSLAKEGLYLPRTMSKIRTTEGPNPLDPDEPLYIATFDVSFEAYGDEAVVELRAKGGSGDHGAIVRGWAVTAA